MGVPDVRRPEKNLAGSVLCREFPPGCAGAEAGDTALRQGLLYLLGRDHNGLDGAIRIDAGCSQPISEQQVVSRESMDHGKTWRRWLIAQPFTEPSAGGECVPWLCPLQHRVRGFPAQRHGVAAAAEAHRHKQSARWPSQTESGGERQWR